MGHCEGIPERVPGMQGQVNNSVMEKRKICLCVWGDQQTEGVNLNLSNLYSPVMKATEARLLAAITAEHDCLILKTDTLQAFLMIPLWRNGRQQVVCSTARLVARAYPRGLYLLSSQKHVWYQASSAKVVPLHNRMDGEKWLPCSQQWKDDFH